MNLQERLEQCRKDKAAIEEQEKELLEQIEKETRTHRRGNYFLVDSQLSQLVSCDYNRRCCLIHVDSGNRWLDSIKVQDVLLVTDEELHKMTDNTIVPISKKEAIKIMESKL